MDDDLEQIRRRRLEQLQAQQSGMQGASTEEAEQAQAQSRHKREEALCCDRCSPPKLENG